MSTLPVNFSVIEPSGRVRQSGVHFSLGDLVFEGATVVYQMAPPNSYWRDGAFKLYPTRPSASHEFDYSAEEWFDPRSIDDLRAVQWEAMKRKRSELLAAFPYLGVSIQSDADSMAEILLRAAAARDAIENGGTLETTWMSADNLPLQLTAEQMAAMPLAMSAWRDSIHETSRQLRQELANADTPAEVKAVRWPEAPAAI